jgi:hypothetical protein
MAKMGSTAKAYRTARDAGMSNEKAFQWATGRTAASVYSAKGTGRKPAPKKRKKTTSTAIRYANTYIR